WSSSCLSSKSVWWVYLFRHHRSQERTDRFLLPPTGVIRSDASETPPSDRQAVLSEDALSRARGGDENAFRELVDPYRGELQLHCYRILGSLQDAEDQLQETRLAACRRPSGPRSCCATCSAFTPPKSPRCSTAAKPRSKGRCNGRARRSTNECSLAAANAHPCRAPRANASSSVVSPPPSNAATQTAS